jgi:subtilisin family serine protease
MGHFRRVVAACAGASVLFAGSWASAAEGDAVIVRARAELAARLQAVPALVELGDQAPGAEAAPLVIAPNLAIRPEQVVPVLDFEVADPDLAARLGLNRYYRLALPVGADIAEVIQALSQRDDLFETVEREYWGTTAGGPPNDPFWDIQWNLRNIGQGVACPPRSGGNPGADIAALGAWNIQTGSPAIVVAVLDSGVTPHIDLPPLRPGWSEDGLSTSDQCNHGTHVAGTIAALTNNNVGIAGVMWNASILPVRVLRGCSGTDINYGRGIIWAADRAHIANSSLQYYNVGSFYKLAIRYAYERGLVMVAATGNYASVVAFPARLPEVIGVGATTFTDEIAVFSNQGPQVALSAPGENVYSLMARTFVNNVATGSGCLSGTSMASPHVAGVAGLIKSMHPLASPGEVHRILVFTADDRGAPGFDPQFGWGRLNAQRAIMQARCYVDCDLSGKLDANDIQCFSARFVDKHPYADMDDDGRFTAADLTLFMEKFKLGCPR